MSSYEYEEYSAWARQLAASYSKVELQKKLSKLDSFRGHLARAHLKAIDATTSMSSQSQRRAHTRNSVVTNYEEYKAVSDALEIHRLYPDRVKDSKKNPAAVALGSIRSERKAITSRLNGIKGGRPKQR